MASSSIELEVGTKMEAVLTNLVAGAEGLAIAAVEVVEDPSLEAE